MLAACKQAGWPAPTCCCWLGSCLSLLLHAHQHLLAGLPVGHGWGLLGWLGQAAGSHLAPGPWLGLAWLAGWGRLPASTWPRPTLLSPSQVQCAPLTIDYESHNEHVSDTACMCATWLACRLQARLHWAEQARAKERMSCPPGEARHHTPALGSALLK